MDQSRESRAEYIEKILQDENPDVQPENLNTISAALELAEDRLDVVEDFYAGLRLEGRIRLGKTALLTLVACLGIEASNKVVHTSNSPKVAALTGMAIFSAFGVREVYRSWQRRSISQKLFTRYQKLSLCNEIAYYKALTGNPEGQTGLEI